MPESTVRIGTSSWADPEFVRDWYPSKLPASARLAWYAQYFDYVEVNSTFYAIPAQRVVDRWIRETPIGFLFDVKLPGLLSRHAFKAAALPQDIRQEAGTTSRGTVVLTPHVESLVAQRFSQEIEPLRAAGKLGALLLQLSPSFSPRKHRLDELDDLIGLFCGDKVAVELRNRDWLAERDRDATLAFFRDRSLPLVLVDAPQSEHFTVMQTENNVTDPSLAYLRLHGRNVHGYITGKSVAERFDYDYSPREIVGIAGRVSALAAQAREVHAAFNNNRSNYAPSAAMRLKATLNEIS